MNACGKNFVAQRLAYRKSTIITTSLYNLVAAINEEVEPALDDIVAQIVLDVLHLYQTKGAFSSKTS